jgi:hypothetical protein
VVSDPLDKHIAPEGALERLLTLREVAELLQLDERTVRRWIVQKGLP